MLDDTGSCLHWIEKRSGNKFREPCKYVIYMVIACVGDWVGREIERDKNWESENQNSKQTLNFK